MWHPPHHRARRRVDRGGADRLLLHVHPCTFMLGTFQALGCVDVMMLMVMQPPHARMRSSWQCNGLELSRVPYTHAGWV